MSQSSQADCRTEDLTFTPLWATQTLSFPSARGSTSCSHPRTITSATHPKALLRFSHSGTHESLALPALKRVIRVETLSQSAKALLPPHKCGGSHHQFGHVRREVGRGYHPCEGDGRKWFIPLPTGDVLPGDGTPPHDDPRHAGPALADRHSHRDEHNQCDSPRCGPRELRR
jgi:hypothetical protein